MRKRLVVRLAVAALVIGALATGFRQRTRPIPFDAAAWRQGDPKLRFRMKDALLASRAAGELATRAAVDAALGPDDDRGSDPRGRFFRLSPWYGNPWYLRITFDGDGKVTRFMVAPD